MRSYTPVFATVIGYLTLVAAAGAVEVSKANSTTTLNLAGSWVSGGPPGLADIAVWNTDVTTTSTYTLGVSVSWAGLKVVSPALDQRIRPTTGLSLTLGAAGVDLTGATRNFAADSTVLLAADQSWNIAAGRTLSTAGLASSSGYTLTKSGAGILSLTGVTVFAGGLSIAGGSVQSANTGGIQELSGALSGAGPFNKSGVGALVLSGDNTNYTGALTLTAGSLNLNRGSALGGGTLTLTGGSLGNTSGAAVTLTAGSTQNWNGDFSYAGTSDLDLGGSAVTLSGTRALTVGSNTLTVSGTLGGTGSLTKLGVGTLRVAPGAAVDLTGKLATTAGVLRIDGGTVACGVTGGNFEVGGSGAVELNGGTLVVPAVGGLGGTSVLSFNGGVLRASAGSTTFMSGLASAKIGAAGAVIEPNGNSVTVSQVLSHDAALGVAADGGLLVRDALGGTVTLTGASTYTGPTVIESGTLALGTGGSLAGSKVIQVAAGAGLDVATGATLSAGQTLTGTGNLNGKLTVGTGATLAPGGSTTVGSFGGSADLTLLGTASFRVEKLGSFVTNDAVTAGSVKYGGTLVVISTGSTLAAGDSFKLFEAGSYDGSFATIQLPEVSGLLWDLSQLNSSGTIAVSNAVPVPTFNPPAGGYFGAQSITISGLSGSTIYYTTDGSDPALGGPGVLSGSSPLSGVVVPNNSLGFTIRAYAAKAGFVPSAVVSATYQTPSQATWIHDGDGSWNDPANWLNAVIPNASGIPVDFSTLSLTADRVVSLEDACAVGGLKFGDPGNAFKWSLRGSPVLTLDTQAGVPGITVDNQTTLIEVPLAGNKGLFKNGYGTLVLAAANTYTGTTTVNQGTLQLGTGSANGRVGNYPYAIAADAKLRLDYATAINAGSGTWSGNLTGAGTLELKSAQGANGGANWGPNSPSSIPFSAGFTGTLDVINGRMDSSPEGMGQISKVIIRDGAQFLAWTGSYPQSVTIAGNGWGEVGYPSALRVAGAGVATWTGSITLAANAGILSQDGNSLFTLTGPISGPHECDFIRNGPIVVAPAAAVQNSYASTKISSNGGNGVVLAGNAFAFSSGGLLMNGGVLALGGYSFSFANLSGTSGLVINNAATGPSVITVGSDHTSTSCAATLLDGSTGTLGLTKVGTGTLTLTAANTHTGPTTVNAGVLAVNGSLGAASTVTVAAAGTLGGTGTVGGPVNAAGVLAPGASATATGALSTGAINLTGIYQCQLDGTSCDVIAVTGNLNLTGATLAVAVINPPTLGSYLIATYTGTRTGTFATLPAGYTVDYATPNQVKLTVGGGGYAAWIAGFGLAGDAALAGADPDRDGIANSLEFVLGGNPAAVMDAALLPTLAVVTNPGGTVPAGTYLKFSYRRSPASAYLNPGMEFDADLTGAWTAAVAGQGGVVEEVTAGFYTTPTPADRVDVFVPRAGNEAAGKLFGHLRVVVP